MTKILHYCNLSSRSHIKVAGQDALSFLHRLCTSDLRALKPGQGCETFFLNHTGHVVGHVFLFLAVDGSQREKIVLEAAPTQEQTLLEHLERYHIREKVSFEVQTDRWAHFRLFGPAIDALWQQKASSDSNRLASGVENSSQEFASAGSRPVSQPDSSVMPGQTQGNRQIDSPVFRHVPSKSEAGLGAADGVSGPWLPNLGSHLPFADLLDPLFQGIGGADPSETPDLNEGAREVFKGMSLGQVHQYRRFDHGLLTGEPGGGAWRILRLPPAAVVASVVPRQNADDFKNNLDAIPGTCRVSPQDWDAWRIWFGFPEFGRDITAGNLGPEVTDDPAVISTTKGCYLGQEVVARIESRGHVNRKLVGLVFESREAIPPQSPLQAGGQSAGLVTSAAHHGGIGRTLGLGYVRPQYARDFAALESAFGPVSVRLLRRNT